MESCAPSCWNEVTPVCSCLSRTRTRVLRPYYPRHSHCTPYAQRVCLRRTDKLLPMRVCEPTGCVELAGCEWRLLRPNDPAQTIISERGALGLPPTLCVCKPCDPRCVPPLTPHCQRVLTGDPAVGCRQRAPSPGAASRRATMRYVFTARSRRRRGPA